MILPTMVSTNTIHAASDRSDNANNFGEGARHLGQTGQMGEHSSGQDEPRKGVGNVLNEGDPKDDPDSKHPGDLADALCPEGSNDPLCP